MRNLTVLVLIGTFSAALLDYVLKVEARHTFGPGEPLLRFFALFHTGTAVLSFVVQTFATLFFESIRTRTYCFHSSGSSHERGHTGRLYRWIFNSRGRQGDWKRSSVDRCSERDMSSSTRRCWRQRSAR